jgi:short-subunit dehydrogenase
MGVAVVTGASAGVGRATARALAARGYDVALLARGHAGLDAARRDVEAAGRRALAITVDVGDAAQVDAAATRAEVELGEIDVWVNNAMTTVFAWFHDVTPEEYARATSVTYLGQVYGTMAALRRMRPRDRGRIVNVGSALAFVGIPLQAAYCGAKFGVRGFTESVRAELLHDRSKVTISLVHLPAVNTPQFEWCRSKMPNHPKPVPPVYQPEVAARAIVQAALDGKRSRIVGSWNTALVGATGIVPAVVAQYAARTAVASQQSDQPVPSRRSSNLCEPVDGDHDAGACGTFGDHANGVRDVSFLRSLPRTFVDLVESARAALRG